MSEEQATDHQYTIVVNATQETLAKGRLAYVGGRLKGRTWTGRDGLKRHTLDVVANELRFLSPQPRPAGMELARRP